MSEQLDNSAETGEDDLQVDELSMLKQRAKMMGITFSNNIGVESLREKIQAKMEGEAEAQETVTQPTEPLVDPVQAPAAVPAVPVMAAPQSAKQKATSLRNHILKKAMKLVRIRVVCLNPAKKELPGEFITVANEHLGTVTKYVPFGEATDNGYHVPECIYKMLKGRKFNSIRTFKDRQNANAIKIEQRWVNEFSIEVLEPLTRDELMKLAAAQTAGGNLN